MAEPRAAGEFLTPRQAAQALPGRHHPYKIVRWILDGLLVGERCVHLEARKIGGRWWIAALDLAAFIERVESARGGRTDAGTAVRAAGRRHGEVAARRRHRLAMGRLERMGMLTERPAACGLAISENDQSRGGGLTGSVRPPGRSRPAAACGLTDPGMEDHVDGIDNGKED
jgi:hypothetical protein